METLFMVVIIILAYSFAWYAGYLVEQGNYALAAFNAVTVAIQLYIFFNIMEDN